jgi:hypothetical protein
MRRANSCYRKHQQGRLGVEVTAEAAGWGAEMEAVMVESRTEGMVRPVAEKVAQGADWGMAVEAGKDWEVDWEEVTETRGGPGVAKVADGEGSQEEWKAHAGLAAEREKAAASREGKAGWVVEEEGEAVGMEATEEAMEEVGRVGEMQVGQGEVEAGWVVMEEAVGWAAEAGSEAVGAAEALVVEGKEVEMVAEVGVREQTGDWAVVGEHNTRSPSRCTQSRSSRPEEAPSLAGRGTQCHRP